MTEELNFNINLHSVATLRETDGLALSSRNLRLTPEERKKANIFYRALLEAKDALNEGTSLTQVKIRMREMVESHAGVSLEYFELADSKNLNLLENVEQSRQPIMCIAGYIGEIRLIDNMFLHKQFNSSLQNQL